MSSIQKWWMAILCAGLSLGLGACGTGVVTGADADGGNGSPTADGSSTPGGGSGTSCSEDSDCPSGETCQAGTCRTAAVADAGTSPGTDASMPYDGPVEGSLVGFVREMDGSPIAGFGVRVEPGDDTGTTDDSGAYQVEGLRPGNYIAHFEKDGYLAIHRRFQILEWERVTINVTARGAGGTSTVDSGSGGTVSTDATSVSVSAGALVTESGTPVTGAVDFTVVVTDGTIEVGATQAGMPVALAPGESAVVVIPLPASTPLMPGDIVTLSYLDETTGMWIADGTGVVEERGGRLVVVCTLPRINVTWRIEPTAAGESTPLTPSRFSGEIDAGTGGDLTSNVAVIEFTPGSLIDETGTPVTGEVDVTLTGLDPTTSDLEAAPGDYVGLDPGANPDDPDREDPLVSYGMIDVVAIQDGMPVDLVPGQTVAIEVPVPEGSGLTPGDEVPLWYFDEDLGVWVREGTAVVQTGPSGNLVMVGSVGRVNATWNCDAPATPVCFRGQVVDCAGYPIAGAEVTMRGPMVTSLANGTTNAEGRYEISGAASGGMAILSAELRIGDQAFVAEITASGSASCTDAPDIVFADVRYVGGTIELSSMRMYTWDGTGDSELRDISGSASFWDLNAPEQPAVTGCAAPPLDELRTLPLGGDPSRVNGSARLRDVGNPIALRDGTDTLSLERQTSTDAEGNSRISYSSMIGASFPYSSVSRQLDVSIPGAAGSMPSTNRSAALHAPAELIVTSPAAGAERSFVGGSTIPIRWETAPDASGDAIQMVTLSVIPLTAGSTEMLFGFLNDDGSYDLDTSRLGGMVGPVRIVISRSVERYEGLAVGPSMMVRGSSVVNLDATIR